MIDLEIKVEIKTILIFDSIAKAYKEKPHKISLLLFG